MSRIRWSLQGEAKEMLKVDSDNPMHIWVVTAIPLACTASGGKAIAKQQTKAKLKMGRVNARIMHEKKETMKTLIDASNHR